MSGELIGWRVGLFLHWQPFPRPLTQPEGVFAALQLGLNEGGNGKHRGGQESGLFARHKLWPDRKAAFEAVDEEGRSSLIK